MVESRLKISWMYGCWDACRKGKAFSKDIGLLFESYSHVQTMITMSNYVFKNLLTLYLLLIQMLVYNEHLKLNFLILVIPKILYIYNNNTRETYRMLIIFPYEVFASLLTVVYFLWSYLQF